MRSNHRHPWAALLLLPWLLVMGPGRGVVMCVGPTGHVQLEALASACCAPAPIQGGAAGDAESPDGDEDEDCGSCLDIEIGLSLQATSGARKSARTSPEGGPWIASPVFGARCLPSPIESGRSDPRATRRAERASCMRALRTTVLRC